MLNLLAFDARRGLRETDLHDDRVASPDGTMSPMDHGRYHEIIAMPYEEKVAIISTLVDLGYSVTQFPEETEETKKFVNAPPNSNPISVHPKATQFEFDFRTKGYGEKSGWTYHDPPGYWRDFPEPPVYRGPLDAVPVDDHPQFMRNFPWLREEEI